LERHRVGRIGWLRAAVLGANDGIVSTASLVLGVAAANATHGNVMVAGLAGLVAGRCRWPPASTCRSARSRIPSRRAQAGERGAQGDDPGEQKELTAIYVGRGLDHRAREAGPRAAHGHDALGAHAATSSASPRRSATAIQAALTSAASFAVGAAMPLLAVAWPPGRPDRGGLRDFAAVPRDPGRARARVGARAWGGRDARHVLGRAAMAVTAGAGTVFGRWGDGGTGKGVVGQAQTERG